MKGFSTKLKIFLASSVSYLSCDIYMHVYVHTLYHTSIITIKHSCISVYIYTNMFTCKHICIHSCISGYTHACNIYECILSCMYVCIHTHICTDIHICVHAIIHTCKHTYILIYTDTHCEFVHFVPLNCYIGQSMYMHRYLCMSFYISTCIFRCKNVCIHPCISGYTDTYMFMYGHIHTCTYIFMHIY